MASWQLPLVRNRRRNGWPSNGLPLATSNRSSKPAPQDQRAAAAAPARHAEHAHGHATRCRNALHARGVHPGDLQQFADLSKFPFTAKNQQLHDRRISGTCTCTCTCIGTGQDMAAGRIRHLLAFGFRRMRQDKDSRAYLIQSRIESQARPMMPASSTEASAISGTSAMGTGSSPFMIFRLPTS